MTKKFYPVNGQHLYIHQRTGDMWVDQVRRPYTVVDVKKDYVDVRECKAIFKGPQYYDTLPDSIEDDPNGRVLRLHWAPKKCRWQHADEPGDRYPLIACFGEWDWQPYLN